MGKPRIIIDPGHGGSDPGAVRKAEPRVEEEDLTLEISLYQQRRFETLGVPTALTRTADVNVDLDARAALVRSSGARLCISNHINAGGGVGAEVIVSLYSDKVLGTEILSALKEAGAGSRKVYSREHPTIKGKDYYAMQRKTGTVETVTIEYGFIDSADIKGLLENWRRYAEAVVRATCEYLDVQYTPPAEWTPAQAKPARAYGIPDTAADYQVEDFLDLVDDKIITSPEIWGPNLLEPAPVWFICAMLNRLRKEGKE